MKEWERKRKRGKCHEIKDFLGYITVKLSFLFPIYLSTLPSPHSLSLLRLFPVPPPGPIDFRTEYLFTVKYIFCFGCYCLVSLMFIALFGWLCWIFASSKVKNSIPVTSARIYVYIYLFPTLAAVDKIYIVRKRCEKREGGSEGGRDSVKQASQLS